RSSSPIVVSGTVRDPQGRPVAAKRIVAQLGDRSDSAITRTNGTFSLSTTANASGFFSLQLDAEDYVIHADQPRDHGHYCDRGGRSEIAIVADRAASISGKIVDSSGRPVFDAEVQLLVADNGSIAGTAVARTTASGDGSFALERLDARIALFFWLRVTSP